MTDLGPEADWRPLGRHVEKAAFNWSRRFDDNAHDSSGRLPPPSASSRLLPPVVGQLIPTGQVQAENRSHDHCIDHAALKSAVCKTPTFRRAFHAGRPSSCRIVLCNTYLSSPSERNSLGPLPVAFRKARAKLAGDEYPSSADTRVIDSFVCRSNSVARCALTTFAKLRKSVPARFSSRCSVRTLVSINSAVLSIDMLPLRTWVRICSKITLSKSLGAPPRRSRATSSMVTIGHEVLLAIADR